MKIRISVLGSTVALMSTAWSANAAIPLALLDYVDVASPAYLRYKDWVDSVVFNGVDQYGFSASDAVYLARLNGHAAYCAKAVSLVEAQVSEAEAEIAAGRRPPVSYDSYLEVGGMISDLALTYDWCSPQTSSAQRNRWAAYAQQAVWNIWNHTQASWGGQPFPWSGWSVNDPGNNYYYSFIEATMYWSLASNDAGWRQFLETEKFPQILATFGQLTGGGSREGTGYGLANRRLFEAYRFWRTATGTDLASQTPHARDSVDFWIHATVPTLDRFAPIGDQSRVSYPDLFDYHRMLMLDARTVISDESVRDRASWWLSQISVDRMQYGFNFRHDMLPTGSTPAAPTATYFHATGTGNLFARSDWGRDAMWLHFIAGPFDQSHAHEEQGGVTIFARDFLTVTENIFSHSGLPQETDTHNVVRFVRNGATVPQRRGTTSTMNVTTLPDGSLVAVADLTSAYAGATALSSWQRQVQFAQRVVRVSDSFALGSGTEAIFQLNTPVRPVVDGNVVTAGDLKIRVVTPSNPVFSIVDWHEVDPNEFSGGGYKLEIRGGSTGYVVELSEAGRLFSDGFE